MGQESAGVLTRDNKCHNTIKAFDEQVLWYDAAATLVTIGLFHTRKVLLLPSNSFEASECKWSLFYFCGFSSERGRPTASCWVRLRRGCTIAHCAPCTRTGFRTTQKNHSLADLKHLFEICRFLILSALIDLDECVETICEMSMLMLNCQGLDDLLFHFGHRRKSLHCDCISAVRPQVQLIIVTSNTNDKPASRWQWMTIEDRMTIKDGNWNVLND